MHISSPRNDGKDSTSVKMTERLENLEILLSLDFVSLSDFAACLFMSTTLFKKTFHHITQANWLVYICLVCFSCLGFSV